MGRGRYDPTSRHGMMRAARAARRQRRREERWARSEGFATLEEAEARYDRVEADIFAELDSEALRLGTTRSELLNETMDREQVAKLFRRCNPYRTGRLFEDLQF